ncbi:3151_t:CDS:10 [Ambispora leptoticha]|uniref:3151_t:CDS:1 n=1 Tax=Ambispora leptoticha TaxID=144679 RepID=A0A9N8ZWJ1_9GLOM|nr:3151_t:CDS:10 [Ambispora leptoticha]
MAESSMNFEDEETVDPCCMGCGLIIEEGNVVAFGEDGNPICENCSYDCHVCKKPILDEAIMTGDESFHIDCFRCRQCRKKIDDLIFAKASQGIYCMTCHNDRVSKIKRAKEKEKESNLHIPQTSFEKSLPSLPKEQQKHNNLQLPNRSINAKRSFERPTNPSKIAPRTSAENIPKAHTLPPNPGRSRRQSRIFEGNSIGDVFKNKVSTPTAKAFEQFTSKPISDKSINIKSRSESLESSKKAGLFSKRNESLDNLSRIMLPSRHRDELIDTHSRNSSITSSRSDPSFDISDRSFSVSSQSNEISDIILKNSESKREGKISHKKNRPPNFINHAPQNSLPNITESHTIFEQSQKRARSSEATPAQTSPTESRSTLNLETGPPLLPPLSFDGSDDEELSKLLANVKLDRAPSNRNKNRRSRVFSFDEAKKISDGIEGRDENKRFGDETSSFTSIILHEFERKNSDSSIGSSGRDIPTVKIESDSADLGELKQELLDTQKNLASAESKLRKIKRASQLAFDEYNEEYNREVALRKEAEESINKLRAQLALQSQQISNLNKEKEKMEKMIRDSQIVKKELDEMKTSLKELDVQKELIIKEIEGLAKEKQAGLAGSFSSTTESTKDLPVSLARHISTHLDQVKQNYLAEIIALQSERDSLKQETEQLRNTRNQCVEEVQILNAKNLELAELNNELTKQIDTHSKSKGHHNNSFNFFRGNKALGTNETNNVAHWASPGHSPGGSIYSIENLDVNNQISTPKFVHRNSISRGETPKKFKWKKNNPFNKLLSAGATVASDTSSSENKFDTRSEIRSEGRSESSTSKKMEKMANLIALNQEQKKVSNDSPGHRVHNWQQTSFLRPIKCEHCQEKMWGLTESGTRCIACGMSSHTKCSALIFGSCSGVQGAYADTESEHIINTNATLIFGNDLSKQLELEKGEIPYVVQKCVKAVEARGMDFEGIYRKTGGFSQMRAIVAAFEQGDEINLDDPNEFNDIGAVTSVLKQYFRQLPNPLFTFDLYPKFLEALSIKDQEEKLEKFRTLISQLPKENYATLKFLMHHLQRIRENASENLMTAKNLAVVFGPTLLRGPDANSEILDMNHKNAAIEYIILNTEQLFQDETEPRPDGFI